MIQYEKVLSLEFYNYKGIFTGSLKGMRYKIQKKIEKNEAEEEISKFEVFAWPEPYNFETTEEALIVKKEFEFSEEGKKEVVNWLNTHYQEQYENK